MSGLGRCVRVLLRTNVGWLVGSALVLAALVWTAAASVLDLYPDQAHRDAYAAVTDGSVAVRVFQGRGYDLAASGGIFAQEMAIIVLSLFPLLALHLAIRLTRRLEDRNYLDIVTAGTIHRQAPLVAGLACAALSCTFAAGLSFAALVANGYPVAGSTWYAVTLFLFLLWGTALGLLTAQLFRSSTEAHYAAVAVALGSYLIRGLIDIKSWYAAWTNPASWFAEVRPFADRPQWWPLAAYVVLIIVCLAAAAWASAHRDLGGGVFAATPGPPQASRWLSGVLSLMARLVRGHVLAIVVVGGVIALVFGLFAQEMATDGLAPRLVLLMQLNGLLAASSGIVSATTLAREESAGRTGRVLSAIPGRLQWFGLTCITALGATLLALLLLSLASGIGLGVGLEDSGRFTEAVRASFQHAPAALFIVSVALALGAVRPRLASVTWVLIGWAAVVALRADLLQLSDTLRHLSPLEWTGKVPVESWASESASVLGALAALLLVAGAVTFRRRDLVKG